MNNISNPNHPGKTLFDVMGDQAYLRQADKAQAEEEQHAPAAPEAQHQALRKMLQQMNDNYYRN